MTKYTIGKIKMQQEIAKFLVVQYQSMAIMRVIITAYISQYLNTFWNRLEHKITHLFDVQNEDKHVNIVYRFVGVAQTILQKRNKRVFASSLR